MSHIRPLERDDLPAVANLLELVFRSGSDSAPRGLTGYLARIFLDQPWADREIPSLVYLDHDGRVVGFLGSHVRRFRFDGSPISVGVSGQLAIEPDVRRRAAGAFLLQRYLSGPQALTMTDSASQTVRRMWEGLGGASLHLQRMGWVRLFRPARFATEFRFARRPRGVAVTAARILARPADGLMTWIGGRYLCPERPQAPADALTPQLVVEHLPVVAELARLHADYDVEFLEWLFGELAAIDTQGTLVGRLVRRGDRTALGWYVYYLKRQGISQVLQIAGQERDLPTVIDHLFHHAYVNGAAALQGRVEPELIEPLSGRRCVFHVGGYRVLVHARNPEILQAIESDRSVLSRLDGDWWIRLGRGRFDDSG